MTRGSRDIFQCKMCRTRRRGRRRNQIIITHSDDLQPTDIAAASHQWPSLPYRRAPQILLSWLHAAPAPLKGTYLVICDWMNLAEPWRTVLTAKEKLTPGSILIDLYSIILWGNVHYWMHPILKVDWKCLLSGEHKLTCYCSGDEKKPLKLDVIY